MSKLDTKYKRSSVCLLDLRLILYFDSSSPLSLQTCDVKFMWSAISLLFEILTDQSTVIFTYVYKKCNTNLMLTDNCGNCKSVCACHEDSVPQELYYYLTGITFILSIQLMPEVHVFWKGRGDKFQIFSCWASMVSNELGRKWVEFVNYLYSLIIINDRQIANFISFPRPRVVFLDKILLSLSAFPYQAV